MTLSHYFIFLICLCLCNITVLYSYFLYYEAQNYQKVHNTVFVPVLKNAYPIQISSFLIGSVLLFYFTEDKSWYYESKFLYFLGMTTLLIPIGYLPLKGKTRTIVKSVLEFGGITGLTFIFPYSDFLKQIPASPELVRIGIAVIWFTVFKFFCVLNRFEGMAAIQAFHIGLSSLLVLVFIAFTPTALLQINSQLFLLIFLLTPLIFVLQYSLPLNETWSTVLCFCLTGLSVFMALTGNWSVGILMIMYVLFELVVVCYRFIKNFIFRQHQALFFYQGLLDNGLSKEQIVNAIIRYHFLMSGLILFIIYASSQVQAIVLALFLYLRLYYSAVAPQATKSSLIDLYRQAKKDAKKGILETERTINELKEKYNKSSSQKKDTTDEQS